MMTALPDGHGRTLHDRIFKEFLHRFLPDFLHIFFPEEAARLDFSTLTFLDQELRINLPEQVLRVPDFVAEVSTLDGEREAILVHVEVEGRDRRSLPQRMFEYYSLLRILRQKKVLPLALVLQPQAGGVGWAGKCTRKRSLAGRCWNSTTGRSDCVTSPVKSICTAIRWRLRWLH